MAKQSNNSKKSSASTKPLKETKATPTKGKPTANNVVCWDSDGDIKIVTREEAEFWKRRH